MSVSLVTPEIRSWIGRESEPFTGEPILARDIKRYAIAIGDENPIYHDAEAATSAGHRTVPAPLGYVYWAAHPWTQTLSTDQLQPDGLPASADPLRLPLEVQRVVRGGDEYEFFARLYAGDRVTLRRRVADVYEREGKNGPMVFVIEECTYTNDRSELVAKQKITRIYR
jgi:acyl dehydratase